MKNVLIINQSAELYGADKAILELIVHFPEGYNPIVVVHEEGPLKELLQDRGVQVIKTSVIKVKRGILKPTFFLLLPFDILRSILTIRKAMRGKKIDLIHSNATSVFIGAFYAFLFRKPHLWHVHEIIEEPKRIARVYPGIVGFFADRIVFNSNATAQHFLSIKPNLVKKSQVIHNGQKRITPFLDALSITRLRGSAFQCKPNDIVIGLVGRISRLKGQLVLLEAFRQLTARFDNIHLVYIGSAPAGQEVFLYKLQDRISEYLLQDKVTIIDFQHDIWPYYDAMDIVVVPSTEPESFGLVATEGMLSRKPVVASAIGGLVEIVSENETGFLFEPKNSKALAEKLALLLDDEKMRKDFGENGFNRVRDLFTTEKFCSGIVSVYESLGN